MPFWFHCFRNCHIYLAIVSWDDTEYGGLYPENPLRGISCTVEKLQKENINSIKLLCDRYGKRSSKKKKTKCYSFSS